MIWSDAGLILSRIYQDLKNQPEIRLFRLSVYSVSTTDWTKSSKKANICSIWYFNPKYRKSYFISKHTGVYYVKKWIRFALRHLCPTTFPQTHARGGRVDYCDCRSFIFHFECSLIWLLFKCLRDSIVQLSCKPISKWNFYLGAIKICYSLSLISENTKQ